MNRTPLLVGAVELWIIYKTFGLFLQKFGRLSSGIRLGWESGFNSGRTLDYVYRSQPNGITPLGRFIDRRYLNGIGWRGIRVRGNCSSASSWTRSNGHMPDAVAEISSQLRREVGALGRTSARAR